MSCESALTSLVSHDLLRRKFTSLEEFFPMACQSLTTIKCAMLVAALDRCQFIIRESIHILKVVVEALCLSWDEFLINISSIFHTQMSKKKVETMKSDFQNDMTEHDIVHQDLKLSPLLYMRNPEQERLQF